MEKCVNRNDEELGVAIVISGFPSGSVVKNLPASPGDARDKSLIPELGRSPGGGNGNSL